VIGIGDPEHMSQAGAYDLPYHVAWGVAVSWPYAYLADQAYGVQIMDVSNPAAPQLAGAFATAGEAYGVTAAGSLVYVADLRGGLVLLSRQQQVYVPIVLRNW